ncbi:unnamed protein product, partial [Ectocarpus fasciculatus]
IVKTQLVFISSCASEPIGNAFVEAGVPHVVAVKHDAEVKDEAALDFSKLFYAALFENGGKTVKQAFESALNCVNATHPGALTNQEGGHFLLLPK